MCDIMTQKNVPLDAPSSTVESSDIAAAGRLFIHIAERRIEYLVATLILYQMGILDKFFTYGSGICG